MTSENLALWIDPPDSVRGVRAAAPSPSLQFLLPKAGRRSGCHFAILAAMPRRGGRKGGRARRLALGGDRPALIAYSGNESGSRSAAPFRRRVTAAGPGLTVLVDVADETPCFDSVEPRCVVARGHLRGWPIAGWVKRPGPHGSQTPAALLCRRGPPLPSRPPPRSAQRRDGGDRRLRVPPSSLDL